MIFFAPPYVPPGYHDHFKYSLPLAAGTMSWAFPKGESLPWVARGVNTPSAKCLIYLRETITKLIPAHANESRQ